MNIQTIPNQTTAQASAFKVGNFEAGRNDSTVSSQWMARPADQRFLSLDDLGAAVRRRSDRAHETMLYTRRI